MSEFAQVLFEAGKPTPLMRGRWRAKGALRGLSDAVLVTRDGMATEAFSQAWAAAFPTRRDLPAEPLSNADGTITAAFHRVWR